MKDAVEAAAGRAVSRETYEQLDRYVGLLLEENERQNLISRSTGEEVWQRHIADSAQLVRFAPRLDDEALLSERRTRHQREACQNQQLGNAPHGGFSIAQTTPGSRAERGSSRARRR